MFHAGLKMVHAGLLAAFLFVAAAPQHALAQEAPKTAATQTSPTQSSPQKERPIPSEVKDEEKKSGESEGDWVKQSGSIRWIAKKTGLSLDATYWLCFFVNFAIIFFFVVKLMRKSLPGFFRSRTAAIQKGIEEARKMSEEARQRLSEVEGRLSRLDADITAMRNEADQNAKAEEQRILAASEEERKRIVNSAEQEISMAASAARRDLKSYAAELAIDLAQKKIRVEKEADQALVREFTARLGKDGN
jgi:F-type H+-transporting ATPase subunit b